MVDSPSQPNSYPTRTVAIIKPHALPHRLDIERRITDAGFEIAKERQMMFHENDRDVEDLFGVNNALALGEGPCWVYVLERRRAVEVLKALMGEEDPEAAREANANSLRALYGTSLKDNAIFGSPDTATAEHQISILFASSPPFRMTELPEDPAFPDRMGSLRSITSNILSELDRMNGDETNTTNTAKSVSSKASANGRSSTSGNTFRARPVPASIAEPTIKPRLSHAAALRAGLVQPKVSIWSEGPRKPLSKEEIERTFANVPGHKRAESIQVASTAPPTVAPRMTRAASLRQGIKVTAPTKPREKDPEAIKKTFEGVPGHKRRESVSVASIAPPSVAPRLNRAAAMRAEKDKAPPSSYMFRTPSNGSQVTSAQARRDSSVSSRPPSTTPRPPSVTSRTSSLQPKPPVSRRPSTAPSTRPTSATLVRSSTEPALVPKRAPSTTPVIPPASIRKPSIEPRQNKSALLRAKKLEGAKKESGKINGKPVFV